jgi:hypothetical protein
MTDWTAIASFATAIGTLVLAVATFSAVRSANRSARIAEEGLLTSLRPLLVQTLPEDPDQKLLWRDLHRARLGGGGAVFEQEDGVIYLAAGLRNAGTGIGLLHGWYPYPERNLEDGHADPEEFRRLTIDLYIPAGGVGYFEAAMRDNDDPMLAPMMEALTQREPYTLDLLYGDQLGHQRAISRFTVLPSDHDDAWYCRVARHWNLSGPAPR